MPKIIDLTGQIFGRLTVIGFSNLSKRLGKSRTATQWNCKCECGAIKSIKGDSLKAGLTRSCGCLRRENTTKMKTIHGMAHHPIHNTWLAMKSRCYNPNNNRYNTYGARGITVCDEWLNSFEKFYADMGDSWFKGATIDRIDNDLNYEKSNCAWLIRKDQSNKRTTSIYLDSPWGIIRPVEAAKILGISVPAMYHRISYWPKERWFESNKT